MESSSETQHCLGIQAEGFEAGQEHGSRGQAQVSRATPGALAELSFAPEIWTMLCIFHKINFFPQKQKS